MIPHARIAKLYQHVGDRKFDNVMLELTAAIEGCEDNFTIDVYGLPDYIISDIIVALETLEYQILGYEGGADLHVSLPT